MRHFQKIVDKPQLFFLGLFIFSILSFSAAVYKTKSILWGDARYYYAYTHSMVVNGDLDFENEAYLPEVGFPNEPERSDITGRITNKFSIGPALLWTPAFVVGWLLSGDGYSQFTQYLVGISGVLFSVLGLYFTFSALVVFLKNLKIKTGGAVKISIASLFILYLTTPIMYYTSIDPINSHSASLMLSGLALLLTARGLSEGWSRGLAIRLGLVGGGLFLVRNQDVLVVLPALMSILVKQKPGKIVNFIIATLGILVAFLIQQVVVFHLFGQFGSPYLIRGESLSWFRPDFIRVLFSSGNGLIFFAPIVLVCLWGVWLLIKQKNQLALLAATVFLFQLYLIACWGSEIIGGPYGSRMFVSSLPWLGVGLGFALSQHWQKSHAMVLIITLLLFINNLVQTGIMLVRF